MNRIVFLLGLSAFFCSSLSAQKQDINSMRETAKAYSRQGDYSNAIVVLNRALHQEPGNLDVAKELGFAYYLQKNYSKSIETIRPLLDRRDADPQCYQILGLNYKAIEERKEGEKMYKQGIKRFPASGELYNEYGEMLWANQDYEAIKLWEKGIESDPNYASNYYNASKFYYFTIDKVWSLVYGEIFVNLESYSKRTPEIKKILAEGYKKLYSDINFQKNQNTKNPFVSAFLTEMGRQAAAVSNGITAETLTILRTRFTMEWLARNATKLPFRLFDYYQQLLKEGMFDAYNQWVFGAVQNLPAFQTWINLHADEYNRFIIFQKGRIFKLPVGQYYHGLVIK